MTKKRMSIETLTEVLINEFDDLKTTSSKIEKTALKLGQTVEKPLNIDLSPIEKLNSEHYSNIKRLLNGHLSFLQKETEKQESILKRFKELLEKKHSRLPNWVFAVLCGVFIVSLGSVFYSWKQAEKYELQKLEVQHWKGKYEEISNKKQ